MSIKKTTITINATDYARIKALFGACSDNEITSVLQKVYYNATYRHIVATDGHMLRVEDIDLGPDNLLLDRKYFNLTTAQQKAVYGYNWYKCNGVTDISIEYDTAEQYPQYEKVIPTIDTYKLSENAPLVGINLKMLSRIEKTIISDKKSKVPVVLIPTSSKISPIMIYGTNGRFYGIIMPLRVGLEALDAWTPITENVHQEIEEMTAA